MAVAGSYLYKAGDVGQCVYFISHGSVSIDLQADRSMLDSRGVTSMQILLHKQEAHGDIHVAGDHFGEFCVVSSSGLRADSAKVLSGTEVYSLSKTDIWSIFQYLTVEQRRSFIFELMTRVGERRHITHTLSEITEASSHDDGSIKNLYRMAFEVMTEIVNELTDDVTNSDDSNSAVRKMIHEASNYGAFTQRDLIDLFVGKSTDETSYMTFSASSMQARLEKANQAKSQFRALLQKRGGLAGVVRQLTKPDSQTRGDSLKADKTPPDPEKRRHVHLQRSPQLLSAPKAIGKQRPSQNQLDDGNCEIPEAPPIPAGGFASPRLSLALTREEEKDSDSSEASDSDSDSGAEGRIIAKAARRFMDQGTVSVKLPSTKQSSSAAIRSASPVAPQLLTPSARRGSKGSSDILRESRRGSQTGGSIGPVTPSNSAHTEDITPAAVEPRQRRRSVDVRLESRNPQHDAQVIVNAVTIARTREGKLQRGNSAGGSFALH